MAESIKGLFSTLEFENRFVVPTTFSTEESSLYEGELTSSLEIDIRRHRFVIIGNDTTQILENILLNWGKKVLRSKSLADFEREYPITGGPCYAL